MTLIRRSYNSGYFDNALHRTYPNSTRNRRRIEMILKHQQSGRLLESHRWRGETVRPVGYVMSKGAYLLVLRSGERTESRLLMID